MNLSPRIRILLGLITITLFGSIGIAFLSEGSNVLGYLLLTGAAYRSYLLIKQIRWLMYVEEEE